MATAVVEVINTSVVQELVVDDDDDDNDDSKEEESVIVVDSSDDDGEPSTKRRRTSSSSNSSNENNSVIDLTEGDDLNEENIRFAILPKLLKLAPFRFLESSSDENEVGTLASLSEHLQKIFGTYTTSSSPESPPSPINPDELEIVGVKESSSSSSTSTSTSCISNEHNHRPKTNKSPSSSSSTLTKEKSPIKDKGKEQFAPECAICLGEMKNITATTCGHIFCKECIKEAIQVTKCCPLCKKKLTLRSIHPIYI